MIEIVVIIVDLRRGELTLIYDVLGGQRTDIEALRESTSFIEDIHI